MAGVFKSVIVLSAIVCSVVLAAPPQDDNTIEGSSRNPRYGIIKALLPFINLRINNPYECKTNKTVEGQDVIGTCMSQPDCSKAGGRPDGECANGYGSCCVIEMSECGGDVNNNRTYIINNNTMTSGSMDCSYTIKKLESEYPNNNLLQACQVRIDFEAFTLAQPAKTSLCTDDTFEVRDSPNSFGKICGVNGGQHIYLPIGSSDTIATLQFKGSSSSTNGRAWRLKTTYIPCFSNLTAPSGCLQYYTENSGNIKSFNYQTTAPAAATTAQIGQLKYSACVSDGSGSCGLSLSSTSFTVSGDATADGAATYADCVDFVGLLVTDATGVPGINNFFCGTAFTAVATYVRPYVISVVTDDSEPDTDILNVGFNLGYSRISC